MTTYHHSQQPNRLGGLTLRASASLLVPNRLELAGNAHVNPMVTSTTWREVGMVCGRDMTVKINDIGGADVTSTKFSTRVGPGSCSPPV